MLLRLDLAEDRGAGADLGALADLRAGQQRGPRPDRGLLADADRADVQLVAVEVVPGEVDLGLDGRVVAELEHARDGRQRVQVDAPADRCAERAGVVDHPGCAGEVLGARRGGEPLGDPQPQVFRPATAVHAGLQPAEQQAARDHRQRHAADRGDEHEEQREHDPPVERGQQRRSRGPREDVVGDRHPREPLQAREGGERHRQQDLRDPRRLRRRPHLARLGDLRGPQRVQVRGERAEPRVVVQVRDGDRRVLLAQRRDQLGRAEGAAALGEEVGVLAGDRRAEDARPAFRDPRRGAVEVAGVGVVGTGQRPGQSVAVDLARGAGGQLVHQREAGTSAAGSSLASSSRAALRSKSGSVEAR